jgi:hypothetical protein
MKRFMTHIPPRDERVPASRERMRSGRPARSSRESDNDGRGVGQSDLPGVALHAKVRCQTPLDAKEQSQVPLTIDFSRVRQISFRCTRLIIFLLVARR